MKFVLKAAVALAAVAAGAGMCRILYRAAEVIGNYDPEEY